MDVQDCLPPLPPYLTPNVGFSPFCEKICNIPWEHSSAQSDGKVLSEFLQLVITFGRLAIFRDAKAPNPETISYSDRTFAVEILSVSS